MRTKWWVAMVLGCLCAVLMTAARTSGAGFSAATANPGSAWQSGTLTLTNDAPSGSVIFSGSDAAIEPGDSLTKCVNVTYAGSWTGLNTGAVIRTYGSWSGGLAQYTTLTMERGSGGTTTSCAGFVSEGSVVWRGKLTDLTSNFSGFSSGFGSWIPVSGALTKTYRVTLTVDIIAAAANLITTGSLTWEAQHPTGGTGYAERVLNDQPAAYWRFNDGAGASVAKEATNQYPGAYQGSPDLTTNGWTLSGWNNAASFVNDGNKKLVGDGVDNEVVVPHNEIFLPGPGQPFSIEFILDTVSYNSQIVPGVINAGSTADEPDKGWHVYRSFADGNIFFKRGGSAGQQECGAPAPGVGDRSHYVITYDGNVTVRGFRNGESLGSCTLAAPFGTYTPSTQPLRFLWGDDAVPSHFSQFNLDEVAFYRKELTAEQAAHHYAALDLSTS